MHRGAERWLGVVALTLPLVAAAGCNRGESEEAETATSQRPSPPPAQPDRTAAADKDLRIMVAELAAAKACEMMRGQFRPLRAAQHPGVVTGVFWMKGCRIAQRGTNLTFHLSGDGWQWVRRRNQAGWRHLRAPPVCPLLHPNANPRRARPFVRPPHAHRILLVHAARSAVRQLQAGRRRGRQRGGGMVLGRGSDGSNRGQLARRKGRGAVEDERSSRVPEVLRRRTRGHPQSVHRPVSLRPRPPPSEA